MKKHSVIYIPLLWWSWEVKIFFIIIKRHIILPNKQSTFCYTFIYWSYSGCHLIWPTSIKISTYFLQYFKYTLWYFISLYISKWLKPQVDLSTFCRPMLSFHQEGRAALLRNAAGFYQASTTAQDHVVSHKPKVSYSFLSLLLTRNWKLRFPSLKWLPDTCHLCSTNRKHPKACLPEEYKNQNNRELGCRQCRERKWLEKPSGWDSDKPRDQDLSNIKKFTPSHCNLSFGKGLRWERHYGRKEDEENYTSRHRRSP